MALTKLDCRIFRGDTTQTDGMSFVAVNPCAVPGRVVFAGAKASGDGLGKQVAYKLALEYFVKGVEEYYSTPSAENSEDVLKSAFKMANSSVYSFGHKLSAGGRRSASLVGVVIDNGEMAVGRVGQSQIYLVRGDQCTPVLGGQSSGVAGVGQNSLVEVELATVTLEAGDVIIATSEPLAPNVESELFYEVSELNRMYAPETPAEPVVDIVRSCAENVSHSIGFGVVVTVGPEAIMVREISDGIGTELHR